MAPQFALPNHLGGLEFKPVSRLGGCETDPAEALQINDNPSANQVIGRSLENGCFEYRPGYLTPARAAALGRALGSQVEWQQEQISMFGREVWVPRKIAWRGDRGVCYRYSKKPHVAQGWGRMLKRLKTEIEHSTGARFNYVLMNRYDDGASHMGWHSDDEPALGAAPVIASVSLGGTRRFRVRTKQTAKCASQPRVSEAFDLADGSLLIMRGASQQNYQHCLTKTRAKVAARINLTFRYVHTGDS